MASQKPSFITEVRKLFGMWKDFFPRAQPGDQFYLPKDKYIDAENIRLSDQAVPNLGTASLTTGNEFEFDLGYQASSGITVYKGYRITIDLSADSLNHFFTINGVPHTIVSGAGTHSQRYNTFVTNIQSAYSGITLSVYIAAPSTVPDTVHAGVKFFGGDYILLEDNGIVQYDVQVIHEYLGDVSGAYVILKTVNNGDNLFILKTNGGILAIDVAVRSQAGTWTNVTVFQTKQIKYATSLKNLIDFCYELDLGNRCSFYYSGTPPRVTYFKLQTTWTTQHAFIWNEVDSLETGNTDGFYTFENVVDATLRQITENFARVDTIVVNNSGGGLTTGNKYYFIRQCIGSSVKTNFGLASNPVSIFSASLTDTRLYGNIGGAPSSKSVTLFIAGLNPLLYDSFELGFVENIDGVLVEWVITTKYPISTSTITHTGFEAKAALTPSDLLIQQVYLNSTGNEVINRDRLFSSDVTIQLTPPELATFTKKAGVVTITTQRDSIAAIGYDHDTVNEYQKPLTIFGESGYMLNEKYRIGIQWKFKNGFVCETCFAQDWTVTYGDASLTNSTAGAGTPAPTLIYNYFPQVTVDISTAPTINGLPFTDVIDGFSIVRLPCIPEVLATGYIMPSVYENDTEFSVGDFAGEDVLGATYSDAKKGGFISPDVLFGNTDIQFVAGDVLKVAIISAFPYNNIEKFPADPLDMVQFTEFYGYIFDADQTLSDIPVTNCEVVAFNSLGVVDMNGKKLSTLISDGWGCQQKLVAVQTSSDINTISGSSYGMVYAQYYRAKANKYGAEDLGNYISCGHYTKLDGNTSYGNNVFGGDTFTQKNITKFTNKKLFSVANVTALTGVIAALPHGVYSYIVEALDVSSVYICKTVNIFTITVDGTNDTKAHFVTWTAVKKAATYLIYVLPPGGLWGFLSIAAPATSYSFDPTSAIIIIIPHPAPTTYVSRSGISYYTQNRNNYQLRYFDAIDDKNYPYTTTDINVWIGLSEELVEGTLKYSQSYTPITPVQIFPAFDSSLPVQAAQPSTLYYSELKIDGSPLDPYRTVLPLNTKSYSQYGRMTNTFTGVNMLILMMDKAVLVQQLDQQQVTTDPNGVDLILGNGTVLGSREVPSSYFGSPMKTGAYQYLTKAGSWYIIYCNPYQNKVYRRGGDGIRVLTEENFIQTFMSNNNQYIGAENSILFGYDQWSQEVLMQAYTLSIPFTGYDAGSTYTAGNVVSVARNIEGGVSAFYGDFYKARTNVPAGKNPTLIANQLNYWEIYRNSNYLLAFNEHDKINDYTSFYKFSCDSFIPYKDTFLTSITFVDGSFHEHSHIFEHNKNTLKYYAASDGSGGTDVAGYVTLLFNEQPAITKLLRNIWISASNLILTNIHFRSSNGRTRTFSVQADIVEKRPDSGSWFSNVKRDATIGGAILPTGTNTTGANDLLTQAPEGETNEVTIFFTNDDDTKIGQINEVLLNGVPKPPYNNS